MHYILASSIAALASRIVAHPLDTLKTRLQVDEGQASLKGHWGMMGRRVYRELYRGLPISLLFTVPALSVYLATYDTVKDIVTASTPLAKDAASTYLIAAVFAEVLSGFFWTPMEVIKIRQQAASMQIPQIVAPASNQINASLLSPRNTNALDISKQMLRNEGWRGFFSGYFLSLVVFVPHSIVYFICYEKMKILFSSFYFHQASNYQQTTSLPFYAYAVCGALSGAVAGGLSNPLDLVKTRWQATARESQGQLAATSQWRKLLELTKTMYLNEGISAFSKGTLIRMLYFVPSTAVSMSVFETLKFYVV